LWVGYVQERTELKSKIGKRKSKMLQSALGVAGSMMLTEVP